LKILIAEDALRGLLRYAVAGIASRIGCVRTAAMRWRLRAAQAHVLLVTVYDSEELRRAAREASTLGYALKHNLPDLESIIRSAMANAG
jgi:DNA-binding NarL/FixJ family response regulator